MDTWFYFGFIMLITIVVIYFITVFLLYIRKNPTVLDYKNRQNLLITTNIPNLQIEYLSATKSVVTHTHLGKRGDMGNQIFQIACLIAAGARSNASVVLSSCRIEELCHVPFCPVRHSQRSNLFRDCG